MRLIAICFALVLTGCQSTPNGGGVCPNISGRYHNRTDASSAAPWYLTAIFYPSVFRFVAGYEVDVLLAENTDGSINVSLIPSWKERQLRHPFLDSAQERYFEQVDQQTSSAKLVLRKETDFSCEGGKLRLTNVIRYDDVNIVGPLTKTRNINIAFSKSKSGVLYAETETKSTLWTIFSSTHIGSSSWSPLP